MKGIKASWLSQLMQEKDFGHNPTPIHNENSQETRNRRKHHWPNKGYNGKFTASIFNGERWNAFPLKSRTQ